MKTQSSHRPLRHLFRRLGLASLGIGLATVAACSSIHQPPPSPMRTIHAEVVALEQPITYNRFGSMNPYGMLYALKQDVVTLDGRPLDAQTQPGQVRLRDGKRPRPLVLRVNPGDHLVVHFRNMLAPNQPNLSSRTWAAPYTNLNKTELPPLPGEAAAEAARAAEVTGSAAQTGCGSDGTTATPVANPPTRQNDWPRTRCASITVSGLTPSGATFNPVTTGIAGIPPGQSTTYEWVIPTTAKTSTHLFFSNAAPSGGEGDGGSLVHGLFGALHVEPPGSQWYRSQITHADYEKLEQQRQGTARLNYEAVREDGTPILNLLRRRGPSDFELVGGDLNAIIEEHPAYKRDPLASPAFREFTAIFHDELKTFYRDEFTELENSFTLAGVRDGFGINYGASGMGTMLLANRKGIGPAKDCVECAYEEFFLQSWANGDPGLLTQYPDDPSGVHHSYLNDRVEFRNLHAGPKETHVFHLHAHQWLAQQGSTGTYLDSQTIAPQQGFVYPIYYGGSGNRNRTPGDAIFHCHLYPHFAQGMWELWRVHDVLEDGSRRLPDGEFGAGTDPHTGVTNPQTGTPIPAIVPLPKQAMPPTPAYGAGKNPGFPFFIPGQAGHRAPQPPLDMAHDPNDATKLLHGGLPRHIVSGGTRGVAHLSHGDIQNLPSATRGTEVVNRALATGNMSVSLETATLTMLPHEGTALEQAAMAFHAAPNGHMTTTPEGTPEVYRVNGKAPQPGAPFSEPCDVEIAKTAGLDDQGKLRYRDYHVSAIDTDLEVNSHGWHDPQGRINVLDEEVATFEHRRTDKAKPFFFRANSGDCIRFYHTNRTAHELKLDDFQVATPTDTIGQHIHLVKFDVMSSDGSGNGWNYEDGTFAQGAIRERVEATHRTGGRAIDPQGQTVTLPTPGPNDYQTTVQRWFADPLMANFKQCEAEGGVRGRPTAAPQSCEDRTIRTVFTHDHFGASSIQHHGFYSALLIEPGGSTWKKPNGDPLTSGVGTQAIIENTAKQSGHEDHREFALAVADFALLYDPHQKQGSGTPHGMQHLLIKAEAAGIDAPTRTKLTRYAGNFWHINGSPIDAPTLPEAISKDHHNPYLVNYRNAPLPLRIGLRDTDGSIKRQKPGRDGDLALAFDSRQHGDPDTEIFEGYEGDVAQLRIIQGAQEVQHSLNIHGMRWHREVSNPASPLVSAQEIGISEHFEMRLPLAKTYRGLSFVDYLYEFGAVDDLWNGAWGLIRAYKGTAAVDPRAVTQTALTGRTIYNITPTDPGYRAIGARLKPLAQNPEGAVHLASAEGSLNDGTCPVPPIGETRDSSGKATEVTFYVDAVSIRDWLGRSPQSLPYDRAAAIVDPDALAFVLLQRVAVGQPLPAPAQLDQRRQALKATYEARLLDPTVKEVIDPLVLRANKGDCIRIELENRLPNQLHDGPGDALLPKIVSLNTDQTASEAALGAEDLRPSPSVTLHPQLVSYNMANYNGAAVGYNGESPIGPGGHGRYYWYAGTASVTNGQLTHTPYEFGAVNLTSWGDIINQPSHGLVGALIIEPYGATYHDPQTGALVDNGGISAVIHAPELATPFREHVLLYRDGLNLQVANADGTFTPIQDCLICDDSYDLGEKAFNYHTAQFQARLGQRPDARMNLNSALFPTNFFTPAFKAIPTTGYTATPGEAVRFRVLLPHGRNRQHAFLLYGHDFADMIPAFGSPHSPLMSVGKAITVTIPSAHEGYWIYRDGPAHMWASGLWGSFTVGTPPTTPTAP